MSRAVIAVLAIFAIASFVVNLRAQSPQGWPVHNDARGFSMSAPSGWNFSPDGNTGRIVVRGPMGEQIVVWPASIAQPLNAQGATVLVQQMARQVDAQMPWSAATANAGAVRTVAKGQQRSGAAMMTWSSSTSGTSVLFYCVEAPANSYGTETETFSSILRSFRLTPGSAPAGGQGAPSASGPITFMMWHEPHENAFTLAVPQGWQAVGGLYHLAATDVRTGVVMASPDGQIRVRFGDSNVGSFTEPSQMMARAGLREGMYYGEGDGSRLLIQRYLNGPQAAQFYAQTYTARECSGLQIVSGNARPDLVQRFGPEARAGGIPNAEVTAGEVTLRCNMRGTAVNGKFTAVTVLPFPARGGLWYFYRLYGYLAAPGREQDAERVAEQASQSFRINPQWQAQQQQIANSAVATDNARSQQIQQQSRQAIQQDQQETSNIIMQGWEQRNQIQDEVSRRQENAILGTLDVVDPETGQSYKIDNYSDYHWMNNSGVIAGNNTGDTPGPDWRQLVTLPW